MDGLVKPAIMQRAEGRMALHMRGDKIERLYQSGCGKVMLPKTYGEMTEAVLLNTAGGITGGDKLDISVRAEGGAVVATTQTAERLYRSSTEPAKIDITLSVDDAGILHWIPQETIVFEGAELDRTIRLDMSSDSRCLMAETIMLGRQAMGESVEQCHFTDQWRLYRDGALFHAEALRLTGKIAAQLAARAGANKARFLTTIIYAGADADMRMQALRPVIATVKSVAAASCWDDRIVIRLLTPHAPSGRLDVNLLLTSLGQQPLPRVWPQ